MSRKEGKVIRTETYRCNGRVFEIPMRFVMKSKARPTYLVDIDEPRVCVSNESYAECLEEAQQALEKAAAVVWQDVLVVNVEVSSREARYYGREELHSIKLDLEVSEYQRTGTGSETMHRRKATKHDPRPFVWPGEPGSRDDAKTWIPDTPANREKLAVIAKGMTLLGEKLVDLLGSKKIVKTLANVGVLQLPHEEES